MQTGFALLLVGALICSVLLSLWQSRNYSRAAQRLTVTYAGQHDLFLVSGRGKGRVRGAIVMLVIDSRSRQVVDAQAMLGATIFAQFHERTELIGPVATVAERAEGKQLRLAVEYAVEQYKATLRSSKARAAAASDSVSGSQQ